jgi:putative ABC transport system permease protein
VTTAATVGVGIMIDSFRTGVLDWLGSTLRRDIYVSAVSSSFTRNDGTLPEGLAVTLAAVPGVAGLSQGRSAPACRPRPGRCNSWPCRSGCR